MKLHRLTLRNLSSLRGEHAIDFDALLGGAGMFLIHGPTGAGKTTILDAICLALYGKTPRLTSTAHAATTTDATGARDGAAEDGAARMLSNGEHEAAVVLEFSLADAKGMMQRYRAGWSIRRANKAADGRFQSPTRKLQRHDAKGWVDEVVSTQEKIYQPVFSRALHHLSFEDFQRTALLAQFAFREFLDADEKDRTELLERLTGSGRFRKLGKSAGSARKEADDAVTRVRERLAGTRLLSPDERAALEGALAAATKEATDARAALATLHRAREHWRALGSAADGLDGARREAELVADDRRALTPALEALAADERVRPAREAHDRWAQLVTSVKQAEAQHADAERAVSDATTTHSARLALVASTRAGREAAEAESSRLAPELERAVTAWHQVDAADSEAKAAAETLLRAEADHGRTDAAASTARTREAEVASELRAAEAALADIPAHAVLRDTAPLVAELGQRVDKATRALRKAESEHTTLARRREHHATQRPDLAAKTEAATALEDGARDAHDAAKGALLEASGGLPVEDAREKLAAAKEAHDAARRDLEALTNHLGVLTAREATAREGARALADLQASLVRATAERADLAALVAELERGVPELETAQRRLAGRRTLIEHRSALEADHACPVCGSDDHPYRVRPETAPSAEETLRELEACEAALSTLHARAKEAGSRLAECDRRATKAEAQRDAAEKEHRKAEDAAREVRAECERLAARVGVPADAVELDLSARARELDAESERAKSEARRIETLVKAERKAADEASVAKQAAVVARATLEKHDTEAQGLEAQLATSSSHQGAARVDLELSTAELQKHLAPLGLGDVELMTGVKEARARAERLRTLLLDRDRLVPALDGLTRTRVEAESAANAARQRAEDARQHCEARTEDATRKRTLATGLLGGERPEAVRGRLDEAVRDAVARERAAEQSLHVAATALERATTLLGERQSQLGTAREATDSARTRLDETLALVGVTSDDALLAQCLDEATRASTAQRRDDLERREHTALGRLSAAEEHHARTLRERPEGEPADATSATRLPELDGALVDTEARREAAESRASEANVTLRLDDDARRTHAANEAELTRRCEDLDAWNQLHEVIGVREGESFARVVQTLHLGHVVEQANLQLARFLPRYALVQVIHEEKGLLLDFRVIDHDQQGVQRPIVGLSGGESFIVSLALALGLAETRGSSIRLETLLIDEGFGSLDEATLGQILVALEALQSNLGVTIGLISHVDVMKAKIPVQIAVMPDGVGRSKLEFPNQRG